MLLALVACEGGPSGPFNNGGPVARVIIAPDSVALPRGETMRLEAMLVDASGNELDGREIRWTSSDTTRVTITSAGMITAASAGSSRVTATSEGKADSVKVIVTD
ncbi:MAG: Ig-like domain-containing protein [Gemmatimonadota bacterium]|nr:Ig-like domain-containing protein [Gemmatimonadota bacterium]